MNLGNLHAVLDLSRVAVVVYSFCIAFVWTTKVNDIIFSIHHYLYKNFCYRGDWSNWNRMMHYGVWYRKKPFTCAQCMCGWLCLIGGILSGYTWESILLCAAGLTVGGIFEAIKMRLL